MKYLLYYRIYAHHSRCPTGQLSQILHMSSLHHFLYELGISHIPTIPPWHSCLTHCHGRAAAAFLVWIPCQSWPGMWGRREAAALPLRCSLTPLSSTVWHKAECILKLCSSKIFQDVYLSYISIQPCFCIFIAFFIPCYHVFVLFLLPLHLLPL